MNSRLGEAVNGCIGIAALVMGATAVVIGVAAQDWRSALIAGLSLLALAATAALCIALDGWDALGSYGMVSAIGASALLVLSFSRDEMGSWWWRLAWFWFIVLHGLVFFAKVSDWRQSLSSKVGSLLAFLFLGGGLFFLISPLR